MTARTPKRAAQLGVSDDEYAARLEAQRGHCALCDTRPTDHDPARSWRCRYCQGVNRERATAAGRCDHCSRARPKPRRLDVDHEHGSMRVRGLLCHRCNRALPTWVTADWLIRAALYVDPAGEDETARARAYAYAVRPVTP